MYLEKVKDGEYAQYPYMPGYRQPEKDGYIFVGWAYKGTLYTPDQYAQGTKSPFGPVYSGGTIFSYFIAPMVYCTTDTDSVDKNGGTVTVQYYAKTDVIITSTDVKLFVDSVKTTIPSSEYTMSTDEIVNGKYRRRRITFKKNEGEEGRTLCIYAKYGNIESDRVYINQNGGDEIIIPNSDYFHFTYSWTLSDGTDLDSATVLYVLDSNGEKVEKSFTGKPVGYATSGKITQLMDNQGNLCVMHSGDNRNSGAEGAIVCLSNIANSHEIMPTETIVVEVYANWYITKSQGNMAINCYGYKSKQETPDFWTDINRENIVDTEHDTSYVIFSCNKTNADESWNEPGVTMHVNAYGSENASYKEYGKIECLGNVYSHIATVKFNISADRQTFHPRTEDNGIDWSTNPLHIRYNRDGVEKDETSRYPSVPTQSASEHHELTGIYFNYFGDDVYLFDNPEDYILLHWPSGESFNEEGTRPDRKIYLSDLPLTLHQEDTIFMQNLSISRSTNKKLHILFDTIESTKRHDLDIHFFKVFDDCRLPFDRYFAIYQNKPAS